MPQKSIAQLMKEHNEKIRAAQAKKSEKQDSKHKMQFNMGKARGEFDYFK